MKLKSGAHLEERAGKSVYLVLGEKEILLTGSLEQVVSKIYFDEVTEAELMAEIPDAHQTIEQLADYLE